MIANLAWSHAAQLYASDVLQEEKHASASSALASVLPRLFPFFRHNIRSVRTAVMQTLIKVLNAYSATASSWLPPVLLNTLRMVYQNIILEADPVREIRSLLFFGSRC